MVPEVRTITRKTIRYMYIANSWQGNYDKYIRVIGDKDPCNLSPDKLDTIHRTLYRLLSNPSFQFEIHLISLQLEFCIKTQRDWWMYCGY